MIPPETPSPFEGKTVFGNGCDNCVKLQAENKKLKEELEEAKKKHNVNLKRKWSKPDEYGVIEHI